jgi:pimeloyl-ACP methyl ester carboxylesterase
MTDKTIVLFFNGYSTPKTVYKNFMNNNIKIVFHNWTYVLYTGNIDSYLKNIYRKYYNKKVVLIGHSYGASIALYYLSKYKKHIKSMILLDYHRLTKPLISYIQKKTLVNNFFPPCSLHTQEQVKKIYSVMNMNMLRRVSIFMMTSYKRYMTAVPILFIYSTIIDNKLNHTCVNDENIPLIKHYKNQKYIFLKNSSHFWFMNKKSLYSDVFYTIYNFIQYL